MTTLTEISGKTKGSAFLFEDVLPAQVFTPEDLSEEHLAVGRMIDEFWASEVEPNLPAIARSSRVLPLRYCESPRSWASPA